MQAVCPGKGPGGGSGKLRLKEVRRSWRSSGNPVRVCNSLKARSSSDRTTPTATGNAGKAWMTNTIGPVAYLGPSRLPPKPLAAQIVHEAASVASQPKGATSSVVASSSSPPSAMRLFVGNKIKMRGYFNEAIHFI